MLVPALPGLRAALRFNLLVFAVSGLIIFSSPILPAASAGSCQEGFTTWYVIGYYSGPLRTGVKGIQKVYDNQLWLGPPNYDNLFVLNSLVIATEFGGLQVGYMKGQISWGEAGDSTPRYFSEWILEGQPAQGEFYEEAPVQWPPAEISFKITRWYSGNTNNWDLYIDDTLRKTIDLGKGSGQPQVMVETADSCNDVDGRYFDLWYAYSRFNGKIYQDWKPWDNMEIAEKDEPGNIRYTKVSNTDLTTWGCHSH